MRSTTRHGLPVVLMGLLATASLAPADDYDGFFTLSIPGPTVKSGAAADAGKPKDDKPAFAEVIADADTLAGLFTLYRLERKDACWMEIKPEQLERDYILSFTMESGMGGAGLPASVPAGHLVVRFEKTGDRIRLVQRNLMYRAATSAAQRMVERSYSDSPLHSFKVASQAEGSRGSWLVDLGDWFLGDPVDAAQDLKRTLKGEFRPAEGVARWTLLKSYPANTELGATLGFHADRVEAGWSVSERPLDVELTLRASLAELPADGYQPRLADPRVGYFETGWRLWGDDTLEDPMIRVINRWRLEKKDPAAALSEPVTPITFWLENAIPQEYRADVRQGVELWNHAFEAAGFKNAIVVEQMPDSADWDPADIRYNTIRWISSNEPNFGAMGPSQVNPFTGEILNADIVVEADMVRSMAMGWRRSILPLKNGAPTGHVETGPDGEPVGGWLAARQEAGQAWAQEWHEQDGGHSCQAAQALAASAAELGASLLESGRIKPGEPLPREVISQYLVEMVVHEVGHTLGLRHNFAASNLLSYEQLWDSTLTAKTGLVGSVMEYTNTCVAQPGKPQGDYFTRMVGPYDIWAIQCGYQPTGAADPATDLRDLQPLLGRSAREPGLRYATDEDAYDVRGWGSAVDPTIRVFDLSNDEEAWVRHNLANNRRRLSLPPSAYIALGEDPALYRRSWENAFASYWFALSYLPRNIGGYRYDRRLYGEGPALTPLPAAQVRSRLTLLLDALVDPTPWSQAPEALAAFGPGWGWSFDGSNEVRTLDPVLRRNLQQNRGNLLADLYCPARLARLDEQAARLPKGTAFTLDELFRSIRDKVWAQSAADWAGRDLQRIHVSQLTELLLAKNLANVPTDARLLARSDLQWIAGRLANLRKAAPGDRVQAAHLQDLAERVELALKREREKL